MAEEAPITDKNKIFKAMKKSRIGWRDALVMLYGPKVGGKMAEIAERRRRS
jgi:hypothetical protein